MPDRDDVARVAGEWAEKAENDLRNAVHTLKLKKNCPTDTVCFHAQQCVEKYLKALLVQEGVDFPKIHDIEKIVALLPHEVAVPLAADEQARLTVYATATRYPGSAGIPIAEARKAVAAAKRVRRAVRGILKGIGPRTMFD